MDIIQTVVIKQILTEKSKQDLMGHFRDQMLQLKKECEQLQFERKKMETLKKRLPGTLQSFNQEIEIRTEKIKMFEFRMEQLHILPLGSEIKQKDVQAIINVEVGDSWDTNEKTIIIKDGIVIEIR
jgi:hypothetical protein